MVGHFISEVCEVQIVDEIVNWRDEEGREMFMPLRKFRIQHARHSKVLADYDAKKAPVIRLSPQRH